MAASKAKTLGQRVAILARIRPQHLLPRTPQIAEPTTGETMGQATERMAKENGITRATQDEWALRSHLLAAAGTADSRLGAEIAPCYASPRFEHLIDKDNGIRADTTLEKLAALKPVFDHRFGTLTTGNSSPLTDGASAVLVMSEERARADGLEPLGRIRSYAFTALDPAGQLLAGPAYAAPIALDRADVTMTDIGLMEMHEAFAAQILSNLQQLDSRKFVERELGTRCRPSAAGEPKRHGRIRRDRTPVRCNRRPGHHHAPQRDEETRRRAGNRHCMCRGRNGLRDGAGTGLTARD